MLALTTGPCNIVPGAYNAPYAVCDGTISSTNRSLIMGDKGGKKDKEKAQKQKTAKLEQETQKKQQQQQKTPPK
jgi:hypothetical protein